MTAIARQDDNPAPQWQAPTALDEWVLVVGAVAKLAAQIADTPFVPDGMRGNPAAVTAAILTGREMGLGPMTSLANIHVIKGKPGKSAEIQRAMVLAAGHAIRPVEVTDSRAVLEGRRRGDEQWIRVAFTADQARRAKIDLGGYPEDKLYARATTRLCRRVFPDVVGGIQATVEELEDNEADGPVPTPPEPRKTAKRAAAAKPVAVIPARPMQDAALPEPYEPDNELADVRGPALPGDPEHEEEPEPRTTEADQRPITTKQLTAIHTQLGELDVADRDDKLAVAALLAGRPLATSKDLTRREAGQIIDILASMLADPTPGHALSALLLELEEAKRTEEE